MSVKTLRLSEVANLPSTEKYERYREFLRERRTLNGELTELDKRVATFEGVYEMSSDTLLKNLSSGKLSETAEIGLWLTLIELRSRVRKQS